MSTIVATIALTKPLMLVHVMPWFQAPPKAEGYGWHWTMGKTDPARMNQGKPDIAAHLHPNIGPYDSRDPDVALYQTLLMKFAGFDGLVIDWYGHEDVHDYGLNHQGTLALVEAAKRCRLKVAFCYEDQTIPQIAIRTSKTRTPEAIGKAALAWLDQNVFGRDHSLAVGGKPVLFVFGPQALKGGELPGLLSSLKTRPWLLTVHNTVDGADGGFDWPLPNSKDHLGESQSFFKRAEGWKVWAATAYPRFHDYYAEAGDRPSYGRIDDDSGKTYSTTLARAIGSGAPMVQVATWNDYGEGTCIEPSLQYGERDLKTTQRMRKMWADPKFPFNDSDLLLPERWLKTRGKIPQSEFDRIANLLCEGKTDEARTILDLLVSLGQ